MFYKDYVKAPLVFYCSKRVKSRSRFYMAVKREAVINHSSLLELSLRAVSYCSIYMILFLRWRQGPCAILLLGQSHDTGCQGMTSLNQSQGDRRYCSTYDWTTHHQSRLGTVRRRDLIFFSHAKFALYHSRMCITYRSVEKNSIQERESSFDDI